MTGATALSLIQGSLFLGKIVLHAIALLAAHLHPRYDSYRITHLIADMLLRDIEEFCH